MTTNYVVKASYKNNELEYYYVAKEKYPPGEWFGVIEVTYSPTKTGLTQAKKACDKLNAPPPVCRTEIVYP